MLTHNSLKRITLISHSLMGCRRVILMYGSESRKIL